jgi:hypothetical protein
MADWLRPTLRRRARMAQPVVAQWRDPAARVYLPPQPCQWGIPAGCAQVPFARRSWTCKSRALPIVASLPGCHR